MQSLPRPEKDWYDVLEQAPDLSGKFDCEVLDANAMIYPAKWLGKEEGEGPFWLVLIAKPEGNQYRRFDAIRVRRWKPRLPRKHQRAKT